MAYKEPIRVTDYASISQHNRDVFAPGNAFAVTENENRDTLTFLRESDAQTLRDVFQAVSSCGPNAEQERKFIMFHAVNPESSVQHTNSKLPLLHFHVFTSDFADDYSHITDPAVKSCVVAPNADLASDAQSQMTIDGSEFKTLHLDKAHGGEIESHQFLFALPYTDFDDFAANASDEELLKVKSQLIDLIEPTVEGDAGGCRIIIDDRHSGFTNCTFQLLSGENMDRHASEKGPEDDKQRFFQAPFGPKMG